MEEKRRRFRIPNADVELDEIEVRIVHTRLFQRLFYLRQLGLAYLVYPGATHTRGVHSIETLYQATRIIDALKDNKQEVNLDDCEAVRLAALLHDIGHIPFSHTLEDEHEVFASPDSEEKGEPTKHDGEKRINEAFAMLLEELGEIDENTQRRIGQAKDILIQVSNDDIPAKGIYAKDWRSDLVGNTICADLLAYINADAMWTGIEKQSGHYRIYDYFRIVEVIERDPDTNRERFKRKRLCIELTKDGVLRTDVVSAMLDILGMRYTLTERVLFHHAKCTASAMLARAARLVNLSTNDFACVVEDKESGDPSRRRSLLRMGDEVFLDFLEERARRLLREKESTEEQRKYQGVVDLIGHLRSRNLYMRIFKVNRRTKDEWNDGSMVDEFSKKWREKKNVEEALCSVEDEFNLPRGSLVLWCSNSKAGKKLVRANVVWGSNDGASPVELRSDQVKFKFPTVWDRVHAVEEQYNDLWCFWVALDRRYISKAYSIVDALEKKFEVSCDKMFKEKHLRAIIDPMGKRRKLFDLVDATLSDIKHVGVEEELLESMPALDGKDNTIPKELRLQIVKNVIDRMIAAPAPIKRKSSPTSKQAEKKGVIKNTDIEDQLPIPGSNGNTEQ